VRFPQTFIEDLKRQADIVRIVQDFVTLKKPAPTGSAGVPFTKRPSLRFRLILPKKSSTALAARRADQFLPS
jgi:hypothetical protein